MRTVIALAIGAAVLVNELLLGLGHIRNGTFTYTSDGKATEVTTVSVLIMTAGALLLGLAVLAAIGRWRSALVTPAAAVAFILALATIAVMTIPVNLDAPSTTCLALMHVVVGTTLLLAARRLVPSSPLSRTHGPRGERTADVDKGLMG